MARAHNALFAISAFFAPITATAHSWQWDKELATHLRTEVLPCIGYYSRVDAKTPDNQGAQEQLLQYATFRYQTMAPRYPTGFDAIIDKVYFATPEAIEASNVKNECLKTQAFVHHYIESLDSADQAQLTTLSAEDFWPKYRR